MHRRFKWLLRLLPGAFREEHGAELLRVWQDELRESSPRSHGRVWRRAATDTLRVAPAEFASTATENLKLAVRTLRRAPVFAIAAIATLALGIGATAAIFSLINAVLIRPLPWREPDAVGLVWALTPSGDRTWLSVPELEELRSGNYRLESVAGFTDVRLAYTDPLLTREVEGLAVSHDFFRVLGINPALGRAFTPDEDQRHARRTVVLSADFWRNQLGADRRAIGREIRMNGHGYTVIGVLPDGFEWLPASSVLPARVDVWLALAPHLVARDRSVRYLHALARLGDGETFDTATAALQEYGNRAAREFPAAYPGGAWRFEAASFKKDVLKNTTTSLLLLFALVVLVLATACANVANLLLARGESRRREVALKAALGAGAARLAGELMTEGLVLAAAGSVFGLAFASTLLHVFRTIDPAAIPRAGGVGVDGRGIAVMLLLVVISTILSTFGPVVERMRLRAALDPLRDRSAGLSSRAARTGRWLVVGQTTLATAAVITAVFLALTFQRLQRSELGIEAARLLTARVSVFTPPPDRPLAQFFEEVVASVARVPGVQSAGAISQLPLSGAMLGSTFLIGGDPAPDRLNADLRAVSAGYHAATAMPIVRGRAFTLHDTAHSSPIAIVDVAFARLLNASGDVVGRKIRWIRQPDVPIEIVGVAGPVRHTALADPPRPTVYRLMSQYPRASMYVVARTDADPADAAGLVSAAIQAVAPTQPVADVATMYQRIARSSARARLSSVLAATLAGVALLLGTVGLYGLLSFVVSQRHREFGVRLALGGTRAAVRGLVMRDGLTLTASGVVLGLFATFAIVRGARAMLFGIAVDDLLPYAVGTALVVLCAIAALWLPAHRASATDPAVALRQE